MRRTDEQIDRLILDGLKELREAELPVRVVSKGVASRRRWVWAVAAGLTIFALIAFPRLGARPAYAIEDVLYSSGDNFKVEFESTFADGRIENNRTFAQCGIKEVWVERIKLKRVVKTALAGTDEGSREDFELAQEMGTGSYLVLSGKDLDPEWKVGEMREITRRRIFDGSKTFAIYDYDRFYSVRHGREFSGAPQPPESGVLKVVESLSADSQSLKGPVSDSRNGKILDKWVTSNKRNRITVWVDPLSKKLVEIQYDLIQKNVKEKDILPQHNVVRSRLKYSIGAPEIEEVFDVPTDFNSLDADTTERTILESMRSGLAKKQVGSIDVVFRGVWMQYKEIRVYWTGGGRISSTTPVKIDAFENGHWRLLTGDGFVFSNLNTLSQDNFFKPKADSWPDGIPKSIRKISGEPVLAYMMRYHGSYLKDGTRIRVSIPISVADRDRPARDKTGEIRGYRSKIIGNATFETDRWLDVRQSIDLNALYKKP
jgi:hypothetical protein